MPWTEAAALCPIAPTTALHLETVLQRYVLSHVPQPLHHLHLRLVRLLDRVKNANVARVAVLMGAMILFAHWIACVW